MGETAALGVDFGSSHTVAIVRWPDGRVRPLLVDGSPLLPSAVFAESGGGLAVGRDALHSARLDPARFEANPKRRIDDGSVLLGEREIPVKDLVSAVLSRVAEEWRRAVGEDVPPVLTLTCPAAWGATRRTLLSEAAEAAGLGTGRLVAEPIAAATYFAEVLGREVPIGSAVVVHDFGAGTFDASVVVRRAAGFEVLAVDGRDDLGGLDVDAALVAHLAMTYGPQEPEVWQRLEQPSTVEERRAKRQLWDDVRIAKERLSRSPSADLVVPLADIEVHLTREELERLALPILEQTVRVTQGVIEAAKLSPGNTAGVFLVGGSSRIPLMATLLHRALGAAPVAIEQPELVVAEGSVLAAIAPLAMAPAAVPATGEHPRILPPAPTPSPVDHGPAVEESAPTDNSSMINLVEEESDTEPVSPGVVPVSPVPVSPGVPVSPALSYSVGRAAVPRPPARVARVARTRRLDEPPPPSRTTPPPIWATVAEPAPSRGRVREPEATRRPYPQKKRQRRRPGFLARTLRALVIMFLLVVTPVASAVVAFHFATGDPYQEILAALRAWVVEQLGRA